MKTIRTIETRIDEIRYYKKQLKGYATDIHHDSLESTLDDSPYLARAAHYFAGIFAALDEAEVALQRQLKTAKRRKIV